MRNRLFRNASIYTPVDKGRPLCGIDQGSVNHFKKGALYCEDGIIKYIGSEQSVLNAISNRDIESEIDCNGACLIPGFVDPHTHICFTKSRENEFNLRMNGTEYIDILKQGGGILSTVKDVRNATESELFDETERRVLLAQRFGTTTIEIKSGYGLNIETELKMLRVIDCISKDAGIDVVATFLGAHAIPDEFSKSTDNYTEFVIEEMIPAISKQGVARFCDVFCEKGAFSLNQSRLILLAAKDAGMKLKIHADEVNNLGGAGLAAELGAVSADHLLTASEENLSSMSKKRVVAVLLPSTAFSLRKPFADARKMIELNLSIAIATDCNPGSSYTESMPFIFSLAVACMKLSPLEALVASTLNAAYAISLEKMVGSLDIGKYADFTILDGETPSILAYHMGVSPVKKVYKRGELVAEI